MKARRATIRRRQRVSADYNPSARIYARRVEELKAKGSPMRTTAPSGSHAARGGDHSDLICGDVVRELTDREQEQPDFVIVRSDGKPVFHLVNVVDDIEMGITHVIRGEDTHPTPPSISHVSRARRGAAAVRAYPVDPNANGGKMSKRDEGASLEGWQQAGYVPSAVTNYLSLLGWSPKDDSQVMPLSEIIERFDLPQINGPMLGLIEKLQWMNHEHLRALPMADYRERAVAAGVDFGVPPRTTLPPWALVRTR